MHKMIFKDNVYIVFNLKTDRYKVLEWTKFAHLFPENFNPKKVLIEVGELSKLSKVQRIKFDSIKSDFYKYPRKIIRFTENKNKYSISVSPNLTINFNMKKVKKIDFKEVNSFNLLSLDSIIKIIPDIQYFQPLNNNSDKFKNMQFNIIEIDEMNEKAILYIVDPIVTEYD